MAYQIFPLKGVNEIEFGITVEQARDSIASTPHEFRRSNEFTPSDFFESENLFFYYDETRHLEAIEFSRGAQVFFGEKSIFDMNFEQFLSLLKKIDPTTVSDGDGATSHRLSLAIWVPFMTANDEDSDGDDEVGQIESIMIGRSGYFDSLDN